VSTRYRRVLCSASVNQVRCARGSERSHHPRTVVHSRGHTTPQMPCRSRESTARIILSSNVDCTKMSKKAQPGVWCSINTPSKSPRIYRRRCVTESILGIVSYDCSWSGHHNRTTPYSDPLCLFWNYESTINSVSSLLLLVSVYPSLIVDFSHV